MPINGLNNFLALSHPAKNDFIMLVKITCVGVSMIFNTLFFNPLDIIYNSHHSLDSIYSFGVNKFIFGTHTKQPRI